MKKVLLTTALVLIFFVVAIIFLAIIKKPSEYKTANLTIGSTNFRVEIADNPALRQQGLSGRESLPENAGMLFLFPVPAVQRFWMKGMRFPLDIIWIKNKEVVGITIGAEPEAGPNYTIYSSPEPVDKVLELNAGSVQRFGIKVGSEVKLQ